MVQANELKLNNLVYGIQRNTSVHLPIPIPLRIMAIEEFCVHTIMADEKPLSTPGYIKWHIRDISPIPLSEDILIRLGFEKDADGCIKYGKIIYWLDTGFIQIALGLTPVINIPCESVHKVQNLIFTLTGTELTLSSGRS